MSLQVVLYTHNKKTNSTALPDETTPKQEFIGVMIDGADILHPRIAVRVLDGVSPTMYNYAKIPEFSNRYYYIENWVFDGGRWLAFMSVDVLASYKENIGNSSQYILRSASKNDVSIVDNLYPVTSNISITRTDIDLVSENYYKEDGSSVGCYVVGVLNRDVDTPGTVSYYHFNSAELKTLAAYLMGNFSWLNINPEEMSEELAKTLINPLQYIVSCMWFPFTPSLEAKKMSLPYGWWTLTNVSCTPIKNSRKDILLGTYSIPKHSQGDIISYLNAQPYTTCTAVVEPWGSIEIPTRAYNGEHRVFASIDFVTGKGILEIRTIDSNGSYKTTIARREAQVGVPVKLSQMSVDTLGAVAATVQGVSGVVGSVLSGNIGGAISNTMSGISSAIEAAQPNLSATGVDGSYLAYCFTPYIITRHCDTVSKDNERFGSPYSKAEKISEHRGFLMCGAPSITISGAMSSEVEKVNNFIASGFYYE